MRKSLLSLAVISAFATPSLSFAADAAPASPHTVTYNVGLYSQYIFRGLTQTNEDIALQGGVDYAHASGFYAGAWASNVSWLTDPLPPTAAYTSSSLELDLYGGYASTIGDTGLGYNVGALQYIYPGSKVAGAKSAETTEVYGSLSYKWLAAKLSVVVSNGVFGFRNGDGTWYAEANANYPILDTGVTANLHLGRQEFKGQGTNVFDYTDWKIGATKSWSNGVNLGAYYSDTNAKDAGYLVAATNKNIGDSAFTVFIQKTF
ncbi:MAG: TorF family putative porin [Methylotenera sp.]